MAFAAGNKLKASALNISHASGVQSDSGTVAGITYTPTRTGTSNVAGTSFVAPPSGKVMILWHCGITVSAAGAFALVSFQIRQGTVIGSGSVFQDASDNIQIQGTSATEVSEATFYPVSGLTPGNAYNVQLMYRTQSAATTGTFNRPRVGVMPSLG